MEENPRRVLVVDDDPVSREIAAILLEEEGCVVETAESGLEAIRRSEAEFYDLILLDWQLPDIDGMEVAEIVHQRERKVPVILLTGGTAVLPPFPAACGICGMLTKPLEVEDWRDCLRDLGL